MCTAWPVGVVVRRSAMAEHEPGEDGMVDLLCEWADVHGLDGRRVRWCTAVGEEVEAGTVRAVPTPSMRGASSLEQTMAAVAGHLLQTVQLCCPRWPCWPSSYPLSLPLSALVFFLALPFSALDGYMTECLLLCLTQHAATESAARVSLGPRGCGGRELGSVAGPRCSRIPSLPPSDGSVVPGSRCWRAARCRV